ncbi:MAG TPA: sigma-70 family RNA polymerase sigma factor [Lacunisphaera sp.]|nr:sigma-70 family RNA polymerase sigma factor [Lacunisphaera sp.]
MLLVSDSTFGYYGLGPPPPREVGFERMSEPRIVPPPDDERHALQRRLLAALASGDKTALADLYDQLSGPLHSLAYRMLGDPAEAQDLLQDIFVQVWRTAATYEPARGSVFAWMATLTRNRAIDRIRMRKRRADALANAAPDLQPSATVAEVDAGDSLWAREKAAAVRTALAALAPDQQQAIELAYFSGLTQQEIAARLNEPLGTIKARIRRGLLRLKDRLPSGL